MKPIETLRLSMQLDAPYKDHSIICDYYIHRDKENDDRNTILNPTNPSTFRSIAALPSINQSDVIIGSSRIKFQHVSIIFHALRPQNHFIS